MSEITEARPFVYVAGVRRSGTTLLAETLTRMPGALILREPSFHRGKARVKAAELELLGPLGPALRDAFPPGDEPSDPLDVFFSRAVPRLVPPLAQIGVKEITHAGWARYLDYVDHLRVVVLARDPRDIYCSLAERIRQGRSGRDAWPPDPARLAAEIESEFDEQLAMLDRCHGLRVTYEQLCGEPRAVERVLRFVDSPLDRPGEVGALNRRNPDRVDEATRFEGRIGDQSIGRWRTDPAREVRERAAEMVRHAERYARSWGYLDAK